MIMKSGTKRVAAFCFLKNQGQYLLLKRTKSPYYGVYAPVGGSVEPHETPEAAAIRETFEESGIALKHVDFCGILTETSPIDYNWVSFVYTAEIDHVIPQPCEEGVLMWIDKNLAPSLHVPPTDPAIYKYMETGTFFILNAVYDQDMRLIAMKEELSGINIV